MDQDASLKSRIDQPIEQPIVIIEKTDDGKILYRIFLTGLDAAVDNPTIAGIMLSDLVDHLAHAYHDVTGRDVRDIRNHVLKVMHDEDRFKVKDPTRGGLARAIFMGKRQ